MKTSQKILVGLVIALIIINVILMGFIWRNRPARHHPLGALPIRTEKFFQNQLDFDDEQSASFKRHIVEHKIRMEELQFEIRQLNRELHEAIILEKSSDEQQISLQLDSLTSLVKRETTNHIRALAAICRPDQRERLIQALNRIPDRRGNMGKKRRRRRHQ